MSLGYDPEAVIQEADLEMAELEGEARRRQRLQEQGICQHGSTQGWPSVEFRERPELAAAVAKLEALGVPADGCFCTRCEQVFVDNEDWDRGREEAAVGGVRSR